MDPLDESSLSAMAHREPGQYLRITKMALRQYMQECLSQNGQFHQYFEKFANSVADFHVNQELSSDLNKRHIQIAAYYAGMTQQSPQIFIQDGGYDYVSDSLGSINAGWNQQTKDGHQIIRIMDVVKIPIEITATALSEQEIEDLSMFFSMAFGQYQRLTINYLLRPHTTQSGVYWEVRIPLQHNVSPKSHSPVAPGEPRQQLWQVRCTFTVDFENSSFMQYRSQPLYSSRRGDLTLQIPDTLRLGQEHRVVLLNRPDPVVVYSDDARIAIVQRATREWIIRPRQVGTFNLIVARTAGTEQGAEIYTSQEIEVVAR